MKKTKTKFRHWEVPTFSVWEFARRPLDDIETGIVQGKQPVRDEGYMINMRDEDGKSLGNVPLRALLRRVDRRKPNQPRPEDSELLR